MRDVQAAEGSVSADLPRWRARRRFIQTAKPQIGVTDRCAAKLERIRNEYGLQDVGQVVDLITRRLEA